MNIQFVDLKRQYLLHKSGIDRAISEVINETAFISGKYASKFEEEFSQLYGANYCVTTANGTDSLYIIMKSLGIGPGDEVVTVCNSWISSSETISQTGATPIFVDIDQNYFSIDENQIESKINNKTKALLVVHLHGQVCQMDLIKKIADKHNLHLVEDCAQSHFSEFSGTKAGLFGIAGSFSFYPGKNLGAYGDAGAIITNNESLALECRRFANHGSLVKHNHVIEGINSRMDGIQANILKYKLKYIEEWTEKRIEIAKQYTSRLKSIPQVQCPIIRPKSKHSFHVYQIEVEKRQDLQEFLKLKGIPTTLHYPTPLPFLPCYNHLKYTSYDFPVVFEKSTKILSIPIFPELKNSELDHIVNSIESFYERKSKA